jgi:hypothetical protein
MIILLSWCMLLRLSCCEDDYVRGSSRNEAAVTLVWSLL